MQRIVTIGFLLVLLVGFISTTTSATVEVEILNLRQSLTPGSRYTMIIRLVNKGTEVVQVSELTIRAESFINLVANRFPSTVLPKQEGKAMLTLSISEVAPAGPLDATLLVQYQDGSKTTEEIHLSVEEVHGVDIQLIDKPDQINGQDTFTCTYLVTNQGNMLEEVVISSRTPGFADKDLTLHPGRSERIEIESTTNSTMLSATTIISDIEVFLPSMDTTYSVHVPIAYYPTATLRADKYLRFPILINLGGLHYSDGREKIGSARFQVNGQGFIDRRQRILLGFTAIGPDQSEQARFGQYSQYRAQLALRSIASVEIGDIGISLSPLTEASRFGKGFQYEQVLGPLQFTAMHLRPRFFPESDRLYGFSGSLALTDRWNLGGYWLSKRMALLENQPEVRVHSLEVNYSGREINFDMEVAQSNLAEIKDYAVQFEFDYARKLWQGHANLLYAGEQFQGFYNNTFIASFSGRFVVDDRLSFSISATENETNPLQDTLVPAIIPKYSYYSLASHYSLPKDASISFQLLLNRKRDRIEPVDFDYLDKLMQIGYDSRNPEEEIRFQTAIGLTNNYLIETDDQQRSTSLRLYASYSRKIRERLRFGGIVEFMRTNKFSDQRQLQEILFYGGRLSYSREGILDVAFNFRNNFPLDELYEPRSFLDAEVGYQISKHQELSLTAGYSIVPSADDLKQFFLTVGYNQIINMPVRKVFDLGALSGRIYGEHGEKVAGVRLILAGQQVVTDMQGRFSFQDVPPGTHFLQIRNETLGMNEITIEDLPVKVEIAAQQKDTIQLEVVKCSSIRGVVLIEEDLNIQSEAFKQSRPDIFLKLEGDGSTLYTKADDHGHFKFLGLRPGSWTLNVMDSGWTKSYKMDNATKTYNMGPGEQVEVQLQMKPIVRRMKFSGKKLKVNSGP